MLASTSACSSCVPRRIVSTKSGEAHTLSSW